ncbi:MAG TPA: hypothetical protein VGH99_13340 [Pseudonocardia sp.]|jgi:hypothetical protein
MPIRSPKGRGAAYRPLWQWPLRSPARLVGCLVVFVLLGLTVNSALGGLHLGGHQTGIFASPTPAAPGARPAPAPAAPPAPTRLPPVPELTPKALPPADAPKAAMTVATRWTQAWAHHPAGTTTPGWVNGLRAYTTDEYLGVLATVDPTNIPATRVTGAARAVLVSPRSVRVEIPTDAVDLVVLVVYTGTEWRVAGYDRAGAGPDAGDGPPGAPGR